MKEWKIYGLKLKNEDCIRYIGQTSCVNIETRLSEHVSHSNKGRYKNAYWVKKHSNDIEIVLLEDSIPSLEEANKKEIEYIKLFKSFGAKLNNLTNGGDGTQGIKFTDEHRKKLSDKKKGKDPWNKGLKEHKLELTCSFCNNKFTTYHNLKRKKIQKNNFCSSSCSTKHQVQNRVGVFSINRSENGQYNGFKNKE
jgi:hypothetical protein